MRALVYATLSNEHVTELVAERGVEVDASCICRWVQAYAQINIIQAGKNYGWPVISYGRAYSPAGSWAELQTAWVTFGKQTWVTSRKRRSLAFFRNRFWERLTVNIGIVSVFAAFYVRTSFSPINARCRMLSAKWKTIGLGTGC